MSVEEETTPNLGQLCFFDHQQGFVLSTLVTLKILTEQQQQQVCDIVQQNAWELTVL